LVALVDYKGTIMLTRPASYILGQSGQQTILIGSGTINASGLITLTTALPSTPAGIALVYIVGSLGGNITASGLYPATFASTSACQLLNPGVTTAGAYAGPVAATYYNLITIPVPGGVLGPNGTIFLKTTVETVSSVNTKGLRVLLGGAIAGSLGPGFASIAVIDMNTLIRNRNSASAQLSDTKAMGNAMYANAFSTASAANTSVTQDLVLSGYLANSAEYLVYNGYSVEVTPFL
jgi:hypothetical protein